MNRFEGRIPGWIKRYWQSLCERDQKRIALQKSKALALVAITEELTRSAGSATTAPAN